MTDGSDKALYVSGISWDRIWLRISVDDAGKDAVFYLTDESGKRVAKLRADDNEKDLVLVLNITNIGKCRCIASGEYKIGFRRADGEAGFLKTAGGFDPEDARRHFPYGDGSKSCEITTLERDGLLNITARYHRSFSIKSICRKTARDAAAKVFAATYKKQRKIHLSDKNKPVIILLYESDINTSTNLLAIKNAMIRRGIEKDFEIKEIAWNQADDGNSGFSHQLKVVEGLAEADYIFVDESVTILNWLKLDKDVVVTQLWHAGVGFKSAGYARWGHVPSPERFSCHRQYTYGVCGSKKTAPVFAEVWGIDESMILPLGMPRIDEFLDKNHQDKCIKELHELYPITSGKKVILYAPTYRGKNWRDAYYPYEQIDFDSLYDACGSEYVCLFKMHPFIKAEVPIPERFGDRMIDVSTYHSINDLMYITELLITDYSSDIYEFSLLDKPMLFYAFDEEEYASDRGFHLDYGQSAPGKVVKDMDGLVRAVKDGDFEKEKVKKYRERCFDHVDTSACDRIIDAVLLSNK